MTKGRIHSTESFGAVDGPGIRFVIFWQGCNMRCRYCHNPDSWNLNGGTEMSPSDLLEKAERYRSYWQKDGGITVSGGEPLLQIDFLIELFREAKRRGISTCLDTSAQPFSFSAPFIDKFRELMSYTDTVLLDIKHIDNEEHKRLTGHDNNNILECARELNRLNVPIWIRHVLVPGITDSPQWLSGLRSFLDTLNNINRVDILPYHSMAEFKYQQLGIPYSLTGTPAPSQESFDSATDILCK